MRRPNHLIEQIADLDNLYHAFVTARRGKQTKPEVLHFCKHFDQNILNLRASILTGDVSVGKYNLFEVYDPKKRTICAAAFDERVLHHAIINICNPYFERHLISDTYATRKGKGQLPRLARLSANTNTSSNSISANISIRYHTMYFKKNLLAFSRIRHC